MDSLSNPHRHSECEIEGNGFLGGVEVELPHSRSRLLDEGFFRFFSKKNASNRLTIEISKL